MLERIVGGSRYIRYSYGGRPLPDVDPSIFASLEAMFRRRVSTRMLLTLVFCLASHLLWVTIQSILAVGVTAWGEYLRMLVQAGCISVYTALVAPLVFWLLDKAVSWLFVSPVGRSGPRLG